jgi:23S rRNA pseudouridine1911/1915/1917 synthase
MVKISSGDILAVLRKFEIAGDENVPRHISMVTFANPNPKNTLVGFRFSKQQYYILLDDQADDDLKYIMNQIKLFKHYAVGTVLLNPTDRSTTYGVSLKGKEAYLFEVKSPKTRLDLELVERFPGTSRSTWQKHIKAGHVSVNGEPAVSTKQEIIATDEIATAIPDATDFTESELPIVYLDDNVIVINKPVGILSHSKGALNDEFTVADFFARYSTYNADTNRPGIVHRLDRDTSGIMIGARNSETATLLQKQFADRKTKKTYIAVIDGIPKLPKAQIDLPIARNPSAPSTFRVDVKGKAALTKYEVLAENDTATMVRLEPRTGRTHQLRVHMKYIGTPVKGDKVYGKPADRLYLHAASLEITIPTSNRHTFHATIPHEFTDMFPGVL